MNKIKSKTFCANKVKSELINLNNLNKMNTEKSKKSGKIQNVTNKVDNTKDTTCASGTNLFSENKITKDCLSVMALIAIMEPAT